MNATKAPPRPFGLRDRLGYMLGAFGGDFTFVLASTFMAEYCSQVMGIPAAVTGMLVMLTRFAGAVTDIAVGRAMDRRAPGRGGRFRPWLLRLCLPAAAASFLIYQSALADTGYSFRVCWICLTYLLFGSICSSGVAVPYGAMASVISPDPDDRTRLSVWRAAGSALAGLIVGIAVPLAAYTTVGGELVMSGPSMTAVAGAFSLCAALCHLLCWGMTRERVEAPRTPALRDVPGPTRGGLITRLVKNRALLGVSLATLGHLIVMLGTQGMAAYVFADYYGSAAAQSVFTLACAAVLLAVCAPFAVRFARRFGKRELGLASCLFGGVMYGLLLLVRPADPYVYALLNALAFVGPGFFSTVLWAMVADVVDDAEVKTGLREDGAIFGAYSAARKLGQAATAGLSAALLAWVGYAPDAVLTTAAADGLFRVSCLMPVLGLGLSALALAFIYPLTKARIAANAAELSRRRG